jgi:hypothetical protein
MAAGTRGNRIEPLHDTHRQYGPRTTPIVRALVYEDSDLALQQLRRPLPFGSFLGKVMEEHVAYTRVLGYRYDSGSASVPDDPGAAGRVMAAQTRPGQGAPHAVVASLVLVAVG